MVSNLTARNLEFNSSLIGISCSPDDWDWCSVRGDEEELLAFYVHFTALGGCDRILVLIIGSVALLSQVICILFIHVDLCMF